jgi:hypothetical protein
VTVFASKGATSLAEKMGSGAPSLDRNSASSPFRLLLIAFRQDLSGPGIDIAGLGADKLTSSGQRSQPDL